MYKDKKNIIKYYFFYKSTMRHIYVECLGNNVKTISDCIPMRMPDCSKYGATKSMTSSRSDVIVNAATAMSVSYASDDNKQKGNIVRARRL